MLKKGLVAGGVLLAGMAASVILGVAVLAGLVGAVGSTLGNGSGGSVCTGTPTAAATATGTPTATPAATATGTPGCVPPTQVAAAVVALARQMADALYVNPSCNGTISYPNCYYTWYNAHFPQSVIAYGNQVCGGCATWQNGNYQCVSFVRGAYGPIYPLTLTANAFDLWALYAGKPGWQEIPSAAPGPRGMPLPGDVMVFKDTSIGHVAIVMSVVPPASGQNGSITFANANSVSPYTTMPLLADLTVDSSSWPGYSVWGYLRPQLPATASPTPTP